MKFKVLVTREVFDETLEFLAQHVEVESNQQDAALAPDVLAQKLADRDGVMCTLTDRVDAALIGRCPRLKAVANIAVGYNNIDLAACTARGVMATNTPGVLDDSTADLAWALVLGAARRLTELERRVRGGEWKGWKLKQWLGVDVHHATLGIFGMGRIGQTIARRAAGFEMKVLYHNRKRIAPEIEQKLNARYVTKEELLKQSDFVVLQVPYSPETHHMIGPAEIRLMKPTAILVNSTRGGVVDDVALIAALKQGVIRAAGLDVFENEPNVNPALLDAPNLVLTPHIASAGEATRDAMGILAIDNAAAVLAGKPPLTPVR